MFLLARLGWRIVGFVVLVSLYVKQNSCNSFRMKFTDHLVRKMVALMQIWA